MNYKIKYKWILLSWSILLIYLALFFLDYLISMDQNGYYLISQFTSQDMTGIMIAITFLGSWIAIIIICLICLVVDFKKGVLISLNVGIIWSLNYIIKNIVERPRPNVTRLVFESDFSFPSAHAMVSFGLFAFIAYILKDKHKFLATLIMILPLSISLTRVYLGVHYLSDVIGGCLLALTYLSTVIPILKYHKILSDT